MAKIAKMNFTKISVLNIHKEAIFPIRRKPIKTCCCHSVQNLNIIYVKTGGNNVPLWYWYRLVQFLLLCFYHLCYFLSKLMFFSAASADVRLWNTNDFTVTENPRHLSSAKTSFIQSTAIFCIIMQTWMIGMLIKPQSYTLYIFFVFHKSTQYFKPQKPFWKCLSTQSFSTDLLILGPCLKNTLS